MDTLKASVKVGWSPSSRSRRSNWLNMSSSEAPQVPTKAGSTKSARSTICLKPLPRKKPFMLSKCDSPP
ncbi:hypothetical protein D3C72_2077310 [compost metagenome]